MKNGDEVIYEQKVALHSWTLGSWGPGTKRLRLSSSNISIKGLPEIPFASIRGCEMKSFLLVPYVSLQFADSLGEVKRISLYHPSFQSEGTRPQVERLYHLILHARYDKMSGVDLKEYIRQAYGLEKTKTQESDSDLGRIVLVDTKSRMLKITGSILAFIGGLIVLALAISGSFLKVGPFGDLITWLNANATWLGHWEELGRFLILMSGPLFFYSIWLWKKK